jgi:protein phosphatase
MIPAERSHLRLVAQTHPGMSGKNNEDNFAVSAFRLEGEEPLPVVFAVLSDGIGGHRAGEVASELVVESISRSVAASDASQPVETLQAAIIQASQEILSISEIDPEKKGMGATCACVWIIANQLYIAYVGDTRIYLLRNGKIRQLSTDHTWVQEAIEAGILTPEEARDHPNSHVIRRYLGSRQLVEPDIRLRLMGGENDIQAEANQGLRLSPGDQVILCSDGLTDLVGEEEILSALDHIEQEQALEQLIALANERGGHDNITVIALQMPPPAPPTQPVLPARQERRRSLALTCALAGLLVVVLAALATGAFLYLKRPQGAIPSPTATRTTLSSPTAPSPVETLPTLSATETSPKPLTSPVTPSLPPDPSPTPLSATLTAWPTNTITP